jgi:hypothetical protein
MKKEARGKEPHPYRCGEIFEVAYRARSAIHKKVAHDTRHWVIGLFSQPKSLAIPDLIFKSVSKII